MLGLITAEPSEVQVCPFVFPVPVQFPKLFHVLPVWFACCPVTTIFSHFALMMNRLHHTLLFAAAYLSEQEQTAVLHSERGVQESKAGVCWSSFMAGNMAGECGERHHAIRVQGMPVLRSCASCSHKTNQ